VQGREKYGLQAKCGPQQNPICLQMEFGVLDCAISTDLEHMKNTDLKVHSKKAGQKQ
jgi:hypothetical protein